MGKLSATERKEVAAAIAEAEKATTAEFVAVVAARVDRYHVVSLVAAIIAAFAAALAAAMINPWMALFVLLGIECLAFAIVYALFELTPLSVRLAPRRARQMKSRRLAHLLFIDRGLSSLPDHNGVLLLVALAEHQVEIIADHAIDRLAGSAEWRRILDAFTASARTGSVAKALESAIRDLGQLLAKHFPAAPDNPNHLPDRLVEL
jgi:putative membrane protein